MIDGRPVRPDYIRAWTAIYPEAEGGTLGPKLHAEAIGDRKHVHQQGVEFVTIFCHDCRKPVWIDIVALRQSPEVGLPFCCNDCAYRRQGAGGRDRGLFA